MQRIPSALAAFLALFLSACATMPGSGKRIEEASYQPIGGIEQWVTMRGDNDRKPVLLLIHGGPGDVQSAFASAYAPYEHDFVLVQWDQRGAGRTFAHAGNQATDLTLARQIDDGVELATLLHTRFPKSKLILLGHSWGSVIAAGMAQKQPALFNAYVGTGQVSRWADGVQWQYDFLLANARKTSDTKGAAALEAIGKPDPVNVTQYFTFTRPLRTLMGPADKAWFGGMKPLAIANGETEATIKAAGDGQSVSGAALIQTIVHEDLYVTAPAFAMPVCVIQGRDDLNTPTTLAEAWTTKVTAPKKKFSVIEGAGHFAVATHQKDFLARLKACPGL